MVPVRLSSRGRTLIATLTLQAGVIDVSSSESVLVGTGETLSFELFTSNFASTAQRFGLPEDPDLLRFSLMTAPQAEPRSFQPHCAVLAIP